MIQVAAGQSTVNSLNTLQLIGNKQSSVDYVPTNIGGINDYGVIVPSQDINALASFAIQGIASQTGDLLRLQRLLLRYRRGMHSQEWALP